MDEQKTDQDVPKVEEPKPVIRHSRYSPPADDYTPQPARDERVPEGYRWHDCM